MRRRTRRRRKQQGRAIVRREGEQHCILYPDGGAQPLKPWVLKHQSRLRDGYGSHHNGRHKMG